MKKDKLVILAGPSGVGKGTIEKILFEDNSEMKLKLSCSVTTRKPREGEVDGVHYYFVSKEEFEKKIKNNEFIEWNSHFNNFYGTLYSEIENINKQGFLPLLEIETNGALNIMKYYEEKNESSCLISIFITPPSLQELKNRINNRATETEKEIKIRIDKAKEELKEKDKFLYSVINDDAHIAANEIKKIIFKELKNND
ncbi:guanylate kinase [Mesomycoplasma molare]|uniref:Guanylate kinase n=1 Tax=Mesomycoplasma molare TaxID=171288 RepID=A0ABY5TZ15_9BACT|nr:guanylate kinase [Mesomycoplasma molare]UWD34463.1 guanylate kinase [Mesomycoplasma molare]